MGTRTKPLHTRKISAKVRKAHQAAVQAAEGGERWHVVTLVDYRDMASEDLQVLRQYSPGYPDPLDILGSGPLHVMVYECDRDDPYLEYLEVDDDHLLVQVPSALVYGDQEWDYTTQAAQADDETTVNMNIPLWMVKSITKAEQPARPPSLELANG